MALPAPRACECGCGQTIPIRRIRDYKNRRFIKGHEQRMRKPCFAQCHPDKKHEALGLCVNCYASHQWRTNAAYKKKAQARGQNRTWTPAQIQARQEQARKQYRENRERLLADMKDRYDRHKHLKMYRRSRLKRLYGLTTEQYDLLLAKQNGVCAICLGTSPKKSLAVDHDHATGQIRGLLCDRCNRALGLLGDKFNSFERARAYLGSEKALDMQTAGMTAGLI